MNPYIDNLIQQLKAYEVRCEHRGEISAVDILWDYYISVNPPDDGAIKQAEAAMWPIHQALPITLSDNLSDLVMGLTYALYAFRLPGGNPHRYAPQRGNLK